MEEVKAAHEWMYSFPREVTLENIRLGLKGLDILTDEEEDLVEEKLAALPTDIAQWMRGMPNNAWIHTQGTLLDDYFRPIERV